MFTCSMSNPFAMLCAIFFVVPVGEKQMSLIDCISIVLKVSNFLKAKLEN
jgi:hypothetical protein